MSDFSEAFEGAVEPNIIEVRQALLSGASGMENVLIR